MIINKINKKIVARLFDKEIAKTSELSIIILEYVLALVLLDQ